MKNIYSKINEVKTKDDFIEFLNLLAKDYQKNKQDWENKNINTFLEGMSNWTEDMDSYFKNKGLPVPECVNWNLFANILLAAKMYE